MNEVAKEVAKEVVKVAFASTEWITEAKAVLEELVAEHGEEGTKFSVCETFTDAPTEFADETGAAAWHFIIDGKNVTVAAGGIEGADHQVSADYQTVLPMARVVYTEEMIAAARQKAPAEGASNFPSYLVELHNQLALITA